MEVNTTYIRHFLSARKNGQDGAYIQKQKLLEIARKEFGAKVPDATLIKIVETVVYGDY